MPGAVERYLDGTKDGRLHLQHGPIDLVIGVDGSTGVSNEADLRSIAFQVAARRFETVLQELVEELPLLKTPAQPHSSNPKGPVARRMMVAVRPLANMRFITPMAAVAGAVADEIRDAMLEAFGPADRPARIYVNNGGDIALHLEPSASFRIRMAMQNGADLGAFQINGTDAARGIATSGRGGRSLSLGIADSVTVIARTGAMADAAATLIANAVDLPGHSAIVRCPAHDLVHDSDLGHRLVVQGCGDISEAEISLALDAGAKEAERLIALGLVQRAALFLKDQGRIVDDLPLPYSASELFRPTSIKMEFARHA